MSFKVGNHAMVIKDERTKNDQFEKFFSRYLGQIGVITYVDQELVSLKFKDNVVIAYWHNEVEEKEEEED